MSVDEDDFTFDEDAPMSNDGSGSGGPWITWSSLPGVPPVLKKFASAPASFILGVFLSVFIDGLDAIVLAFQNAILAVFDAVAVIPDTGEFVVTKALETVGTGLLNAVGGLFLMLQSAARVAGPFAPILGGVMLGAVIIVAAYTAQFAYTLLVDSLNPL